MNNIDEIFDQVGHLGFQQWKYVIAANLVHVYYAFHMLLYTFVARKLDFTVMIQKLG